MRKLTSKCPFCQEPKLHTRIYACGTVGDRETGVYDKRCGRKK